MDLIVYALLKSKLDKASSEINSKINVLEDDINNKIAILDAGLTPIASKNGDITKDAVTAEAWERLNNESVDVFAVVDGVVVKATYSKNQDDEIEIRTNDRLICTISEEGNEFSIDWNSFYTDVDVNVVQSGLLGEEINLRNGEGSESLIQVGATEASGDYSIALGSDTVASGRCSFASGYASVAGEAEAHAEGVNTEANGYASHAEGGYTSVTYMSDYAHAEGYGTTANQPMAHAEGEDTTADGRAAHAEGCETVAGGTNSHAGGTGTIANTNSMFSGGVYNVGSTQFQHWKASTSYAVGDKVIMLGEGFICTTANSDSQFNRANWQAVGYSGDTALAIGNGTSDNNRSNAMRLDWDGNEYLAGDVYVNCDENSANGTKLISETDYGNMLNAGIVKASGSYGIRISTSDGDLSTIGAGLARVRAGTNAYEPIVPSHQHESVFYGLAKAAGDTTQSAATTLAVGTYTDSAKTAIKNMLGANQWQDGTGTGAIKTINGTSSGNYSVAEGSGTQATANFAHAEGGGTTASGLASHAEGTSTTSSGSCAHAEGTSTKAIGGCSHAEGFGSSANYDESHAEGYYTIAAGVAAHAEGYEAIAAGSMSHAEGYNTTANRRSQHVFGEYNIVDDNTGVNGTKRGTYVEIVGNGSGTNARSNARMLDWNGNEKLSGTLTLATGSANESTISGIELKTIKQNSSTATYDIVNNAATNIMVNGVSSNLAGIVNSNIRNIEVTQDGSTYIFELVESGTNKVYVCNYANSHAAIIPVTNDATSLVPTWYDKYERIYVQYNESTETATVLNDSVATVLLNANIPTIVILTFAGDTSEKEYTLQRTEYQPNYTANSKLVKYSNAEFDNTSDEKVVSIEFGDSAISSVVYSNTEPLGDYVKKTDYASRYNAGVVKVYYGGLYINDDGVIKISPAGTTDVKNGTAKWSPIVPELQHNSAFYGIAKAAGDTTQAQSNNAVGTYTSEAKTAIQSMLGIQEVLGGSVVEISESDPVITATPNTQYICGEVATLSFTPYQIGVSDVIFTSGSTPTVLTLPNTVKMPEWFTIEANRVYEINVSNGIYGSVMSWAN